MFGGFALRANLLGQLELIDSYAPGHQVRFGNLNYTADIRRDLIFDGFGPTLGASNGHNNDGGMDPATEAAYSLALELNTDSTSKEICVAGPPDSFSALGSEPRASVPVKTNRAPIMEFTATDIFQRSPFVTC